MINPKTVNQDSIFIIISKHSFTGLLGCKYHLYLLKTILMLLLYFISRFRLLKDKFSLFSILEVILALFIIIIPQCIMEQLLKIQFPRY